MEKTKCEGGSERQRKYREGAKDTSHKLACLGDIVLYVLATCVALPSP